MARFEYFCKIHKCLRKSKNLGEIISYLGGGGGEVGGGGPKELEFWTLPTPLQRGLKLIAIINYRKWLKCPLITKLAFRNAYIDSHNQYIYVSCYSWHMFGDGRLIQLNWCLPEDALMLLAFLQCWKHGQLALGSSLVFISFGVIIIILITV